MTARAIVRGLLCTLAVAAVIPLTARETADRASFQSPGARTAHGDPPDPTDVSDELKRIYRHIDENAPKYIELLQEWVRIPSISNTVDGEPGVWTSAQFIHDVIETHLGCDAEIHAPGLSEWGNPSHPVVYARCDVGADKTVLDYIQGDVMPVWPEEDWPTPPFGARIIEKPPFKKVMVGKGVSNQKGKEFAELAALMSIKAVTGTLPVNMIFIAEHDEERMDIGPRTFMKSRPELFQDVDAVFAYARTQLADGRGVVEGQSAGCLVFELETTSFAPTRLWLNQQPMWQHFEMMTKTFADDSPLIKELEKDVLMPSAEEDAYMRREAQMNGGNPSYEELLKRRTRVRVTVTGTWSGNMAPGYAGRLDPVKAVSKIDIRYPPNVDGTEMAKRIRNYLDRTGYQDVKMNVVGIVGWSWANADTDIGQAVQRMFRQFNVPFNEPPKGNYMSGYTGYGPQSLFSRDPMQIPLAWGGLGYGWGAHFGPDGEYYVIEGDGEKIYGFAGAAKGYATVLYNYAGKNP